MIRIKNSGLYSIINTERPLFLSATSIIFFWLIARIYMYWYNWNFFPLSNPGKNDVITFWYTPTNFIRDHFLASLYYLRGQPPLPQTILGLLMKLENWPFTVPIDSFLLSLMTLLVAFMLRGTMLRLHFSLKTATILSSAWCLYPGNLAVEASAFPIAFYEALSAFAFMVSLWAMISAIQSEKPLFYWLFAFSTGLMPLTRATMTFISPIPIIAARFFKNKLAKWLGFSALLLQLAWAGKNFFVYQQFHFDTASGIGGNILWAITYSGNIDNFMQFATKTHPDDPLYRDGLPCLLQKTDQRCLDHFFPKAAEKDRQLAKIGVITGDVSQAYGMGDSYLMREISKIVKPLYIDFVIHNPKIVISIFIKSYKLFWGEIYAKTPHIEDLKRNHFLVSISGIFEYYKYFCLIIIHGISLPLSLWIVWKLCRGYSPDQLSGFLLYTVSLFLYVGLVSSLGSVGENTRYRVDVEPLVWLLPFVTLAWFREYPSHSTEGKLP